MSIVITQKRKTEPQSISCHKHLVPLRVVSFRLPEDERKKYWCKVGDILVSFLDAYGGIYCLNATDQKMIKTNDDIFVIRAYEVESITLTQDNDPAPVL